ncbi:copper resistance system multicopper oxidase [Sphingobium subterraneum]|uniref:CopA family copper-resistance protein n=1 Tax=Sphingobium subterraneum TaxID=627688 RepID=A0A841J4H6_9SPHN|nr:copper resistance system multicopper oxidase [Sphingobium subterraneum]MBB6123428.1 CopA family copper-resistance protein [Sphingobium subterraneum]
MKNYPVGRRNLLRSALFGSGALAMNSLFPAWAKTGTHGLASKDRTVLSGESLALTIARKDFQLDGRVGHAVTANGTLPAPLIRLKEGQRFRMAVTNHLNEDTSIHWHGLLVPPAMDGVPGISFPGIRPGETFVYDFPVRQSGTYWYHSHSGLQEQQGHYGPIVIDPAGADPVPYEREHVIVLSDWSFLHPHEIVGLLKKQGGFFNRGKQALTSPNRVSSQTNKSFAQMRMDPTDISDVSAAAYTFLMNGHSPDENWTGLFHAGERVRLRLINASAMSIYNFRIPGLPLTIVSVDGQNVRPVETDEFQISPAETYDMIVTPAGEQAYTIVAESIDRTGMARGTLAPRMGMSAAIPPLRERPTLKMVDMGMGGGSGHQMGGHNMGAMATKPEASMPHGSGHAGHDTPELPEKAPDAASHGGGMGHSMRDPKIAGFELNPGVDMISPMPADRTGYPGLGLENVGHRVLTYRDLEAATPNVDTRPPERQLDIHLTGNMERFMWSFDGKKLSENPDPIRFARNERVRVKLINDTMMTHPIHLHGHFFEIVNGKPPARQPKKHTLTVQPGGTASFDLTADEPGDWAFHCHLLLHMHAGMMRVVTVRPLEGEA